MKINGFCEHCGKKRSYNLNFIDDFTKCKFCKKEGNVKEVKTK